ncbi:hypothetical protein ACG0Z6_11210 [Roseateles sp. BYS180W]|uniref:TonB-dependent receptor n=1 Tax=Roseateles rivi TaxID=3299028 RepID=A0ABW7FWY2_9BURK
MNTRLIQALSTLALTLCSPLLAQAQSQPAEHLPRVVVTGKSIAASQQAITLPRVVVYGKSLASTQQALYLPRVVVQGRSLAAPTLNMAAKAQPNRI